MGTLDLAITGAGGMLGRATLAAARAEGHRVRALVRPGSSVPEDWVRDPQISVHGCELTRPGAALHEALAGVDAVLHLAGRLKGDAQDHARDTLAPTRAVIEATPARARLVLAGSVAVYEGRAGQIDETSPLEPDPAGRDAYARAKLAQEAILRAAGIPATILRIGALTDAGHRWNAHLGLRAGAVALRLAGAGEVPLVHVDDAARALVCAAGQRSDGLHIYNIVGNNLPPAREWLARMREIRLQLPLPWQVLLGPAHLARAAGIPAPGLLRPATLRYRFAPRRWSNARARAELGWQPAEPAP